MGHMRLSPLETDVKLIILVKHVNIIMSVKIWTKTIFQKHFNFVH